jgi:trans-aconitate 2-methyltransferase
VSDATKGRGDAGGDAWNPQQYERFAAERSQPFFDLLELTEKWLDGRHPERAVDLGCGTGELTAELHRRLGSRETLGIDNSQRMLEKAARFAAKDGAMRFEAGEIADFAGREGSEWDVIFSNAALHWVGDHRTLLGQLHRRLAPDGLLAVQMPANDDYVTHTTARAVADVEPYRSALPGGARKWSVLAPEAYATLLNELGYSRQHVRLVVYAHLLESREGLVQWVLGTLLTDYQKRLPAELWTKFVEDYRERLFDSVADQRPFFYPFKRILFCATR